MTTELASLRFNVTRVTTAISSVTQTRNAYADVTRLDEIRRDSTHLHGTQAPSGSGSAAFVLGGRRPGRRN